MSALPTHPLAGLLAVDNRGRAVVAGTTTKVLEIALDQVANGWSPAEIHWQHDRRLSLAQIHAALAHYHANQAEYDREIAALLAEAQRRRAEAEAVATVADAALTVAS